MARTSPGYTPATWVMISNMNEANRSAFNLFHPVVALVYFAALLVIVMATMHPVYILMGFCAAFVCELITYGWRKACRGLVWQAPLAVVIAFANCFFSASGSTELFRIGSRAFFLEGFIYGACMGGMIMTVFIIFSNASRALSSDKTMSLFGNILPTIGLMLSMIFRLVPKFTRRGKEISAVYQACTAATRPAACGSGEKQEQTPCTDVGRVQKKRIQRSAALKFDLRLSSVLMGWGMEDSLETANSMKARGWGVSLRRTTYVRYRFRTYDAIVLTGVIALAFLSFILSLKACALFVFYPSVGGFLPWYSYVPFALYALFPFVLEVREHLIWQK